MNSGTYKTQGFVLKRMHFREAHLLVSVYTADCGKIEFVARSACKANGKLKGFLEPLLYCDLMLAYGKTIDTVISSVVLENFLSLRQDTSRAYVGLVMMDVVDKMTVENHKDEKVFKFTKQMLHFLDNNSFPGNTVYLFLLFFILNFLTLIGLRPSLESCISCNKDVWPGGNYFSLSLGGALHSHCANCYVDTFKISDDSLKLMKFLQIKNFENTEGDMLLICQRLLKLQLSTNLVFQNLYILKDFIAFNCDKNLKSLDMLYDFAER